MSGAGISTAILLAIGVAAFAITSVALLLTDDVYDQVHFLAPASLIGSLAIPAAVLVSNGLSQLGVKAILIAVLLVISNPVLSQAIARAARIRRQRQLAPRDDEEFPEATEAS